MLQNALKQWQSWNLFIEEPNLIKLFNDGLNHHTALIQSDQQAYVLKVFEHSAKQAIEAQLWAEKIGITPAIHYFDDTTLVMNYVPNNAPDYDALAKSLSALHSQNYTAKNQSDYFDLLQFCQNYLVSVDQDMHKMHSRLLPALQFFINDPTPWCFCHNDLVVENCIFNDSVHSNNKAIFIDWEYAQMHNPWFDLAAAIYYFKLSEQQSAVFLEQYQSGWSQKISTPIYTSSQIALIWGDVLWHLAKFGPEYKAQLSKKLLDLKSLAEQFGV